MCGVSFWGPERFLDRVQRPQHISINLRVRNSVPGLRTFLRLSSKTPIHFNVPEGVGFYPRVQIIFGTESRDPNAFHGVELCPKSWDIFGTKFRDPDPFQCPRMCGVPSRGPDHLWERVPRPQCVSINLMVWNSVCPRSRDIFGTEYRDPNSFQCPRRCGVPS